MPTAALYRKTTRKGPAVKNAIVARRIAGEPNSKIAADLGIAVNTVKSVLALTDVDKMLESGEIQSHAMIPKSLSVVDKRLDKQDLDAAKFILTNTLFADRTDRRKDSGTPILAQAIALHVHNGNPPADDSNQLVVESQPVTPAVAPDNRLIAAPADQPSADVSSHDRSKHKTKISRKPSRKSQG